MSATQKTAMAAAEIIGPTGLKRNRIYRCGKISPPAFSSRYNRAAGGIRPTPGRLYPPPSQGEGMSAHGLEKQGFKNLKAVNWNLTVPQLYEESIRRGEGKLAADGPLVVLTGQHTGRSANDKYTVRDADTESQVWWDN